MTILLTVILGAIAAIHAAWGLQIWIPIRDEAALARAVVGGRGIDRMPGAIPCFLVVAALLMVIAALWMPQMTLARLVLWGAALVFLGRGAVSYTPFWRKLTPQEPFRSNDARYFAPLCLALGLGLIVILIGG